MTIKSDRKRKQQGFTLIELLVVVGILAVVILGLIQTFLLGSVLADLSNRKTIAVGEARDKLEEILNHTFASIATDYGAGGTPGNTFATSQITGRGVVTVTAVTASLLQVDVVVCFRYRDGRIFGEDLDLDGTLDAGEDVNGNGVIDSDIRVSTYIRNSA
jgi:prepilin-type N-terminal cleavage/methylation domain-containing protein